MVRFAALGIHAYQAAQQLHQSFYGGRRLGWHEGRGKVHRLDQFWIGNDTQDFKDLHFGGNGQGRVRRHGDLEQRQDGCFFAHKFSSYNRCSKLPTVPTISPGTWSSLPPATSPATFPRPPLISPTTVGVPPPPPAPVGGCGRAGKPAVAGGFWIREPPAPGA